MKKFSYYLVYHFKIFTLILCLVITLISYFLFINPKIKKIFSLESDFRILERNFLLEEVKFNQLTNLKANFEKIDPIFLKKIKKIVPENDELLSFIILLESLIKENNFTVPGINYSFGTTAKDSLSSIQTSLTLSGGNYQSFKNLLESFEKNLRIINIDSISLSSTTATYSLSLKTYFSPIKEKKVISEFPNLKKITDFIQSDRFLTLEEKKELVIFPETIETIQTGRPNPFLPF